jgi:hypothetical protein
MTRCFNYYFLNAIFVQIVCMTTSPLIAQFQAFDKLIQKELEGLSLVSERKIELSKLKTAAFSMGLTDHDLENALRQNLSDLGLHPLIRIKSESKINHTSLSLGESSSVGVVNKFAFYAGTHEVCSVSIKSIQSPNGDTVVVGSIPQIDQVIQFSDFDWPNQAQAVRAAYDSIASVSSSAIREFKVTNATKCLYNDQGFLEPVWNLIVSVDGLQYQAHASQAKVYEVNQRYFDLSTVTLQAYEYNTSGSLANFSVTVDSSGKLTNDYFTTSIGTGDLTRLVLSNNTYSYPGSLSVNFAEASNFAYVNRQYDFATSKGYVWQGPKPITVEVRASIRGNINNALYTPSDGITPPKIQVGQGDGSVLQKLEFDSDVVSHEFGHHLVYQSITNIAGEGLVLHEGLADFLTMASTGDDCLGETICPNGTSMASCRLASNRCLRTASNSFVYAQAPYTSYSSSPHLQGQLVSGYLWDMRKNGTIPSDTLSKYVLQAITYLPYNADLKSFVAALLYTDSVNGGTYATAMEKIGEARGLSADALKINMDDLKGSITAGKSVSTDSTSGSKKGGGFFGCGVIHGEGINQGKASIWMLFFGLPLIFLGLPRRKITLVPVRAQKNPAKRN